MSENAEFVDVFCHEFSDNIIQLSVKNRKQIPNDFQYVNFPRPDSTL